VDGRDKPGHDEKAIHFQAQASPRAQAGVIVIWLKRDQPL